MSIAKEQMEKEEFYRKIAFEGLKEIGAIKSCDMNHDFWYATTDSSSEGPYAKVTNRVKNEYGGKIDFKLLDSQIKNILDQAAEGPGDCPYCAKLEKE